MSKYTMHIATALLGALTLGLSACGNDCDENPYLPECDPDLTTDGVCDWIANEVIEPRDPECVMDGDCDDGFQGDPDCIRDGICPTDTTTGECTDPAANGTDPDCSFCDCNVTDETCIDWFNPVQIDVDGSYAFDPATSNATSYINADGTEIPSEIVVLIYSEDYATTQAPEDVCALSLIPKTGNPAAVDWHAFSATLTGSEVSYNHYGMTMKPGEFDVLDNTLGGQIPGCLEVDAETDDLTDGVGGFQPSVWGDDFESLISTQTWGIYVGEPSAEIAGFLTDTANDDPNEEYDVYTLNQNGYILGASQQATNVGTQVFFYAYGFALDETFNLVATGDEANPYQRLLGSDMTPIDTGEGTIPAARGIIYVRSALYIWQAPALLGQ